MLTYLIRRLVLLVPTLLGVSVIVFGLVRLLPGDPVLTMLGLQPTTPEQVQALRHQLGLDQPVYIQYLLFVGRLLSGDFGQSVNSGQSVATLIGAAMPYTLELTVGALLLAIVVAIPLGLAAAIWRGSWVDTISRLLAVASVAAPNYWVGLLLIFLLSVQLGWLPTSGSGGRSLAQAAGEAIKGTDPSALVGALSYLVLPAVTLALSETAILMRLVRSSMLETLRREFVTTARAKGLTERRVLIGHALRNGLVPVVTVLGLQFGALLGGAVITETIFAWPGIGRLVVQAIFNRDYPVIQVAVLMFGLVRVLANFSVDLVYGVLDPRVRYS